MDVRRVAFIPDLAKQDGAALVGGKIPPRNSGIGLRADASMHDWRPIRSIWRRK